jgi:hypothetical protein
LYSYGNTNVVYISDHDPQSNYRIFTLPDAVGQITKVEVTAKEDLLAVSDNKTLYIFKLN